MVGRRDISLTGVRKPVPAGRVLGDVDTSAPLSRPAAARLSAKVRELGVMSCDPADWVREFWRIIVDGEELRRRGGRPGETFALPARVLPVSEAESRLSRSVMPVVLVYILGKLPPSTLLPPRLRERRSLSSKAASSEAVKSRGSMTARSMATGRPR